MEFLVVSPISMMRPDLGEDVQALSQYEERGERPHDGQRHQEEDGEGMDETLDLGRQDQEGEDDRRDEEEVEFAFRKYLECDSLAPGFARVRCGRCGHDFHLACSCRTRGLCQSCDTRRMVETATTLIKQVLPPVPIRQWVLSVPKRVRWSLRRRVLAWAVRPGHMELETMAPCGSSPS